MSHEAIPLLADALAPFQPWWDDDRVEDILMQRPDEWKASPFWPPR
jgi:hypothetical protein